MLRCIENGAHGHDSIADGEVAFAGGLVVPTNQILKINGKSGS
jgi:hypothetical protein